MSKVLTALNAVQREIMARGIAKDRRNQEQKFNFRGIDDALEAFGPLLAENGVLLSPSYAELKIEPRQTKSGGTTYNATVAARFTFTHMEDGSTYTVGPFYGEANDGQDKAVSKATSVAERNMFFLAFVVPHEPAIGGDPDASDYEEPAPSYADWLAALDERNTVAGLHEVRAKLVQTFGKDKIPGQVIARYNDRLAAIKGNGQ